MKRLINWIKENKIEFILLVFVVLLGAFLRLYRIADYITFLGDEGRDVLVVKRIIVDHKFTLLGPTASVGGFFLGPIYYYFMIPFLWAFRLDPVGPAVMVALFGIATVFLVYKAGKDFFNNRVGLLAAGLYAISPLVVAYSRSSWNPNLMPFFSLLIIWVTWKMVVEDKPKFLLLIGFLFGILIQLHYLATFLMVVIAVYLLRFFCQFKYLKYYFGAIGGFLLGWLPFLLFELRHNFPNFQTLYRFVFFGKETGFAIKRFLPIIADVTFRLFNRLVTNNQEALAALLLACSLMMLFWQGGRVKLGKEKFALMLLSFWLVIGIGLFIFYQKSIYDYYFGFMFPLPFLLTGLVLDKIARINKLSGWLVIFLLGCLVFVNLRGIPFRYPPNRQLDQTKQIARMIIDKTEGKPFNFALITGQNSDHAYRYFLEIWGRKPITLENPQVDPERKTVTDQLLVVCEMADCKPLGHSLWEIAGFGRAEIVGSWPAPGGITIMKLVHYQGNE